MQKTLIGQNEAITFPLLGEGVALARVDTGAHTSAIWASSVTYKNDRLFVVFFGPGHPNYTGKAYEFSSYDKAAVISSNGHREIRYKIKLVACVAGKRIAASFTLADRSNQTYPVLIGRNILRGKFIVDVKLRTVSIHEEYSKPIDSRPIRKKAGKQ